MRRIMVFSLISVALLLEGTNQAEAQIELTHFRSASLSPLVQPKVGSISGIITDPKSHAVAGADVTVLRRDSNAASTLRSFSAITDRKGCFRFAALPIGTYEIRVGWAEMWPLAKPIAKVVVVRSSRNTAVEVQLRFIDECDGNAVEAQSLTVSDRAEIVKWMIEEPITKQTRSSGSTLASDKIVVLSLANIDSSWLPIVTGYKLLPMTTAEIQQMANREGDFMYWQFDKIRAKGSCVAVSISNVWVDGISSLETGKRTRLGESDYYFVFHKQSGKWIGKVITGSIS
jgi:hypothetical protein